MESKRKYKIDNETKKCCKVMILNDKNKDSTEVARWYEHSSSWPNIPLRFHFKINFPLIFYLNA
jgi:hypothetical protein